MKLWQVLFRQFFVLHVQCGSIYRCVEKLQKIEQLPLVILKRSAFESESVNVDAKY
jgi:hypothetical protein